VVGGVFANSCICRCLKNHPNKGESQRHGGCCKKVVTGRKAREER